MIAEYQIEVINSFAELLNALENLNKSLLNETKLPCWMFDTDQQGTLHDHRQAVLHALNQLEYTDDQAPREIKVNPGLVGVKAETLLKVEYVNDCKQAFKKAVLNLKHAKISFQDPILKDYFSKVLYKRPQQITDSLKRVGLARLHLKQCYRSIPILKKYPQKVSWTWANTRSIKKITTKEAANLLVKRGDDIGIQQQLLKLSQLQPDENIAIVQELAPHLRANIVFINENKQVERQMIKGPLPIFFPASEQSVLPEFRPPKPKSGKDTERLLRSDTKINPEPFLPAIRGYRYINL